MPEKKRAETAQNYVTRSIELCARKHKIMLEKSGTEKSIELCQEKHRIMPGIAQNYAKRSIKLCPKHKQKRHRIMLKSIELYQTKWTRKKRIISLEARAARARA